MLSINERKLILEWDQKNKTQQEIAELLGCHQSSVSRLLYKHKRKGTVTNLPRSGRPTKLTDKNLSLLKDKISSLIKTANNSFNCVSTKQVSQLVKQTIGEVYSLRHVERIMHKLGFSLITPRPQHLRHDQSQVDVFRDEFKKNLNRSMWVMK
ncbi:MAG: winged helix-turn-helix domain-containing protein [Nanoarchaeota archaeon]|nr:winged helix-turn-helix domain-containing protein [Nanoarchaeota archaeon]